MNSERFISDLWASGQAIPRVQRGDRYASVSAPHPAKMWPSTARHAIAAFSRPGDLVIDPMAGIGTVLVEAVDLGRAAWGADIEPDWVAACAANLHLARQRRPSAKASVMRGDARHLTRLLPRRLHGQVDLIVTSPPYGKATHGRAWTKRETGGKVRKTGYEYSTGRVRASQLARKPMDELLTGIGEIFADCYAVLAPGARMVVTCRPFTDRGTLVDFPLLLLELCEDIGFRLEVRCAALLAEWRPEEQRLRPIHSFFGLHNARVAIERGRPALLRSHEDVLVLAKDGAR
ncbi:TRM11 family SAM-dependent methyltransferase [Glycomyces paridis]|uniref:TRM11 family SAM-dependent methyltransferase n=1 Tax=Glycomyces paridis TaxID=2126555 RepID=UPI0013052CE8|nr:DNA methyltransferase [Glycomyces paridis]